tara:strand:+ start:218 stop:559 length:342 start_codon:yes stop_codon:yes gene_type:complete
MAHHVDRFAHGDAADHERDCRVAEHDEAQERIANCLEKVVVAYEQLWEARDDERLMHRIDPFDIVRRRAEKLRADLMNNVFRDIANPARDRVSERHAKILDLINRLAIEVGCK